MLFFIVVRGRENVLISDRWRRLHLEFLCISRFIVHIERVHTPLYDKAFIGSLYAYILYLSYIHLGGQYAELIIRPIKKCGGGGGSV